MVQSLSLSSYVLRVRRIVLSNDSVGGPAWLGGKATDTVAWRFCVVQWYSDRPGGVEVKASSCELSPLNN